VLPEHLTFTGIFIVDLDLGQGCVCRDIVYVLPNILGGSKFLLGKPFLAMINVSISLRHDFLSIPDSRGIPIIIEARRYLGHHHWEEKQIEKSEVSALDNAALEAFRTGYCIQHNQKKKSSSHLDEPTYQLYDDEGITIHPWSGMPPEIFSYSTSFEEKPIVRAQEECVPQDRKIFLWKGTIQASPSDITKYIVPILSDCRDYSVEGMRKFGGAEFGSGLFAGYTKESAAEEGLQEFEIDDVIWWVDKDGMSIYQEKRLKRILDHG
jgi:hypothetical protein